MSGMDWWSLPGPRRFLDGVLERRARHGVVAVSAPAGLAGLNDALAARLREADAIRPEVAEDGADVRSPAHLLGARAGARLGIRSVEDLVRAPELDGRTFVVHGIDPARWRRWQLFVSEFRRAKLEPGLGPRLLVVVPGGLRPEETAGVFGPAAVAKWLGYISRIDTETWAASLAAAPTGLIPRMARAASVELSGWNRGLLEALLGLDDELQFDPRGVLEAAAAEGVGGRATCWEDGLVDVWEDDVRVDTLALLATRRCEEVAKRIWRGHVRVLFPFLDDVRTAIVRRHLPALSRLVSPATPWSRPPSANYPTPPVRIDPFQLELPEIRMVGGHLLSGNEVHLCRKGNALRAMMAHLDPAPLAKVQELADLWEAADEWLPKEEVGWDWPRCGQRLTLMVGPPGAGKSTWAARNHPEGIVSTDAIREESPRLLEPQVFAVARERVRKLLACGRDALLDAINLEAAHRALNRSVAPPWVKVRYVVVDRPLEEKIRDGGWRNAPDKQGMIEEGHEVFATGVAEALAGDGVPGIEVVDAVRHSVNALA